MGTDGHGYVTVLVRSDLRYFCLASLLSCARMLLGAQSFSVVHIGLVLLYQFLAQHSMNFITRSHSGVTVIDPIF